MGAVQNALAVLNAALPEDKVKAAEKTPLTSRQI